MAQPSESFTDLRFPVKGIDISQAYSMQPPGTTPTGQNVRAFDPLTARARGGQRPGLLKYAPALFQSTLIQELAVIVGVGYTPPAPSGGPSITQAGSGGSGTGTTVVDTFSSSVTAGNAVLVVAGSVDGSRAFPNSITDGAGNTYSRIDNSSVSNTACSLWLSTNVTGGFTAVTSHWGAGSGTVQCLALELGGLLASPVDTGAEPTGVGTSGTGINFTVTGTTDFIVCAIQANQNVHRTAGSYYDIKTGAKLFVCYKVTTGSVTTGADLTFGFASNTFWAGCQKGLKGA